MITSNPEDGITVEVSGAEGTGKTVVCSIIHKALTESGFVNLSLTNNVGAPEEPGDVPSLLDMIKHSYPHVFINPVEIIETTTGLLSAEDPAEDTTPLGLIDDEDIQLALQAEMLEAAANGVPT